MAASARSSGSALLDIARPPGSRDAVGTRSVNRFVVQFRAKHWPMARTARAFLRPSVLGGRRSGATGLHAKCIVVDDRRAFVTSANLTTAAQEKNIEAGLLVGDGGLARGLRTQFEALVAAGVFKQAYRPESRCASSSASPTTTGSASWRLGPGIDEVNFWQPSGGVEFNALQPGELFLFKLHSPRNFIVGGGFFAHWSQLPVSLAWEAFGEKNGAASLLEMRDAAGEVPEGCRRSRERTTRSAAFCWSSRSSCARATGFRHRPT